MTATALLNGIAVIIDDHINDEFTADPILDIKSQIENRHIPVLGYSDLPDDDEIKHFSNVAFLIIDWELKSTEVLPPGVIAGSTLRKSKEEDLADFIIKLKDNYFGPVFIFSNQSDEIIKSKLKDEFRKKSRDSQCKDFMDYIFIKKKKDLVKNELFEVINLWFQTKPSIYVIKKWDETLNKSKKNLFWHLYQLNHNWPQIFWKVFKEDNTDPSGELRDLLSRNLVSRLETCDFNEDWIGEIEPEIDYNDIRKVLCGEKFIPQTNLIEESVTCGDIFYMKFNGSSSKYYCLNIRPACDCIQRISGKNCDDINMYLIKGQKCTQAKLEELYNPNAHNFNENSTFSIISFINHNQNDIAVRFNFDDLFIIPYGECKENRIGRLLPPYITHIKQKYAAYLQREGLVPTPRCAIPFDDKSEEFKIL